MTTGPQPSEPSDRSNSNPADAISDALARKADPADQLLRSYRQCVFEDANKLRLETIHSAGASRKRDLAGIYVALDTQTSKPKPDAQRSKGEPLGERDKPERISALEAVINHRHVVLHGAPGSGKSTFVQFLSLCLTGEVLYPDQRWHQRLPDWPAAEAALVPFTIELRRFAKESPRPLTGTALPAHLWEYLAQELKATQGDAAVSAARSALEAGRAIILLDGLDEVAEPPPVESEDPTEGRRKQFVRDVILAFTRPPLDRCRVVLTCRTRSYVDQPWALGWPEFALADFDRDRIVQFADFWFSGAGGRGSVARTESEIAAQKHQLINAIDERPHLLEVAGIPLLLTLMAFVHQHERELPRSQAKLYEKIVDLLLFHWKDEGTGAGSEALGLRPLLGQQVTETAFLLTLKRIAWDVQNADRGRGLRKEPADITGERLRNALADLRRPRRLDWANQVIAALQLRAGLLRFVSGTPEAPVFAFLHRSFQEYFAGAYLANLPCFPKEASRLLQHDLPYWQNAVKWAAGHLVHFQGRFEDVKALVRELCIPFETSPAPALAPQVLLAGEILADAGPRDIATYASEGLTCVERVHAHLQALMLSETRETRARAEAGRVLGKLGDPRPGVGLRPEEDLPDLAFDVVLPAREITLLESRQPVCIGERYQLSRYPVTVAQFEAFVRGKGYEQDRFWSPEGRAWRDGKVDPEDVPEWYRDEYRKEVFPIRGPRDFDPVFQTPNHPRVGVSWYEATAFCAWLSEKLQREIRLPHEAEWEQAARWNKTTEQVDERRYPWGGNAKKELGERCNCGHSGIGHTSAVGLFPSGQAECGAMDLSGNVWEWCENWYDEKAKRYRVLRGGSWYDDGPGDLSGSCRGRGAPGGRLQRSGFRCVVVVGGSARG